MDRLIICYRFILKLICKNVLLEAGTAIIFFGTLANHPDLIYSGKQAIQELKAMGYTTPTEENPIRVYPASTSEKFSSVHAGGWRPGIITIRENPVGNLTPDIYLRHELMHEACFRTCGSQYPIWAQEASAIYFSGELKLHPNPETITNDRLNHLQESVRVHAKLDLESYKTLSDLMMIYGWNQKPCYISEEIANLISKENIVTGGFSYILISLISGRILDSSGNISAKYPPGSLLKIPYTASLKDGSPHEVCQELIRSDTSKLLSRQNAADIDLYQFFISSIGKIQVPSHRDEKFWLTCLGERNLNNLFPIEANLYELALMLRTSILYRPNFFIGLTENGFSEGSTLYHESEKDKKILEKLFAITKTGTVSDSMGNPLVGHLMVAWPANDPNFLAVFRTSGTNGASNIRRASPILEKWSKQFLASYGTVRVRLLSLIPSHSWKIEHLSPIIEKKEDKFITRISSNGKFLIQSTAKGSRKERIVTGILKTDPDGQMVILETDPESYADAVLSAEASNLGLGSEARKAMRAVIVWNALHGLSRHPETESLCDTTHCMVYLGFLPTEKPKKEHTDSLIYSFLDKLAFKNQLDWLMFSKGGHDRWRKVFSFVEINQLTNEYEVLEIRRERTRNGNIFIHLIYPELEESVPCELFTKRAKLPSCPTMIQRNDADHLWIFEGIGQGHDQGLSVLKAKALSESGHDAFFILTDAYDQENNRNVKDKE